MQRQQEIKPILRQIRYEIQQAFLQDYSWARMIETNASLACLQTPAVANCVGAPTNHTNLAWWKPNSAMAFYNQAVATAGWSANGLPCNTWSAAGSDACPIRYNLVVTMDCEGASPCRRPKLILNGTLNYSPANRFSSRNRVNHDAYNITNLVRGQRKRFEPFRAFYQQGGGGSGGGCPGGGGWARRELNRLDPGMHPSVIAFDDGGDRVRLRGPGRYRCKVSVESRDMDGGYKVMLRVGMPSNPAMRDIPVIAGLTQPDGSIYASGYALIDIASPTWIQVWQWCGVNPTWPTVRSGDAGGNDYGTPFPVVDATAPKISTTVECIRTS